MYKLYRGKFSKGIIFNAFSQNINPKVDIYSAVKITGLTVNFQLKNFILKNLNLRKYTTNQSNCKLYTK